LKACDWIPKLDDVVKCLGLVLDGNFSSLVLHPQFHEELRSVEGLVSRLTTEAKTCYMMTVVTDKLKIEVTRGSKSFLVIVFYLGSIFVLLSRMD
jgi:hypothetical protein